MTPERCRNIENFRVSKFFNQNIAGITDGTITYIGLKLFGLTMTFVSMTAEASPPYAPLLGLNVYFGEGDLITN